MSTIKQKLAIEKTVENGGNVTQAMRDAGYASATINNPSNLTQSKGFKEILANCGLTEDLVISSLVSDIKNKPEKRLGELSLAADILRIKKREIVLEEIKTIDDIARGTESVNGVRIDEEYWTEMKRVRSEYLKAKIMGLDSVVISISNSN